MLDKTVKITMEKNEFIKKANELKEQLKEQREGERQKNPPKEILTNTERTQAVAKHANESKAALAELQDLSGKMRSRLGYENIESCIANIAEFAMTLYRFLVAERNGFFAQFNQDPIVRDIPIVEKIPSDLKDFLEIDKDGKLDLTKLESIAAPDKDNLEVAVTKFLESRSYTKEDDNVYKKGGVKLTPKEFELLGSIDEFLGGLSDEHFTPPPPVLA